MIRKAIFPGSFDPFTLGHESIVKRSIPLYDEITIAIGKNSGKNCFLTIEERIKSIEKVFEKNSKIKVCAYSGLTVDLCKEIDAKFIIRGLRTASDFEYERAIAQMNKELNSDVETIFLLTLPEHTFINSSIVKDVIYHNGDASKFLPENFPDINELKK